MTAMASASVNRIDLIGDLTGAVNGLPVVRGRNLSTPGPVQGVRYEDGLLVCYVLQVIFRLDSGDSSDLTPKRLIDRISLAAGITDRKVNADDGLTARETFRPVSNLLVVADAPGKVLSPRDYPYGYHARLPSTA
jgi:hypothetical protein